MAKENLRRAEKMNVRAAKETVNRYATWVALYEKMTAVDLVSAVEVCNVQMPADYALANRPDVALSPAPGLSSQTTDRH